MLDGANKKSGLWVHRFQALAKKKKNFVMVLYKRASQDKEVGSCGTLQSDLFFAASRL